MANEGGENTPTPETPVTTPVTTTPSAAVTTPVTTTPNSTGTNAGDDKRFAGLTADLQKERKARQNFETQFKDHQARLAERDRQIAALTGARTPSAEDAEMDEVRKQFGKLYPGLAKLDDKAIERLLSVAQNADRLEEATNNHWQRHSSNMTDSLVKEVSDEIGSDLTPRQRNAVIAAYIQEAENNPEFLEKHERGDVAQLKQFAKDWTSDWFTAAQRKVSSTEANRNRPVPRSGDRSVTTTGGAKKIDFKNPKAVEDAMIDSFRAHGGSFTE